MFGDHLLDTTACDAGASFTLAVRLNWYRALPLSSIEQLALVIDGEPVAREHVTLRLGAADYPVHELSERSDVWWFVLDTGELRVERPGGLAPGEHAAELTMATRIPYFGPAPDESFTVMTDRARTTVVAA